MYCGYYYNDFVFVPILSLYLFPYLQQIRNAFGLFHHEEHEGHEEILYNKPLDAFFEHLYVKVDE
jgi:hypothetical protein